MPKTKNTEIKLETAPNDQPIKPPKTAKGLAHAEIIKVVENGNKTIADLVKRFDDTDFATKETWNRFITRLEKIESILDSQKGQTGESSKPDLTEFEERLSQVEARIG